MADENDQSERGTPGADCIQFYSLESYLFNTVHRRFAEQGYLSAFDFFCIVIWKANRAKTKVAKRLLSDSTNTLDEVVVELTKAIAAQKTLQDKMRLLMFGKIRFRLPMASAILTVLYPDEFTVYDYRGPWSSFGPLYSRPKSHGNVPQGVAAIRCTDAYPKWPKR